MTIWSDGTQTRNFMYIEDCVKGIDLIMHCDRLIATLINLGLIKQQYLKRKQGQRVVE